MDNTASRFLTELHDPDLEPILVPFHPDTSTSNLYCEWIPRLALRFFFMFETTIENADTTEEVWDFAKQAHPIIAEEVQKLVKGANYPFEIPEFESFEATKQYLLALTRGVEMRHDQIDDIHLIAMLLELTTQVDQLNKEMDNG